MPEVKELSVTTNSGLEGLDSLQVVTRHLLLGTLVDVKRKSVVLVLAGNGLIGCRSIIPISHIPRTSYQTGLSNSNGASTFRVSGSPRIARPVKMNVYLEKLCA